VRAHLLVAFVVVAAARVNAHAAPAADVVVAWGPGPLGKLGDAIADAAARAGASYIDASPAATPLPDPRPLIKRGLAAYAGLEFEAAVSALDAAAELVDQTGASALDTTMLAELFLYRALAHEQRADDPRAWEDLVVAAGIDPARVLDPAGIQPRAIERFEQAKSHVAALPRGRITLVGASDCRVRVDGAAVTTMTLELPFGRHWIESSCEGRAPIRRRLNVDRAAFELAIAGALIAPPDDAALLIQARTAAARAIVIVTLQGGIVVVRKLGVDGKQQDRASVGQGDRRAAANVVARLLAPPEKPVAQAWYRSRWVWAAAGVVAASAILIPFAARSSGEAPRVDVRPEDAPPW
jgi:hypothetical protein